MVLLFRKESKVKILITGGAGFIGINTAAHHIKNGEEVTIFDDLSRECVNKNLSWLKHCVGDFTFIKGDVTDFDSLNKVIRNSRYDVIYHMAAQVAVTTSVKNPKSDFLINALGSFNLLESIRLTRQDPIVIYTSTNKVYGAMEYERIVLKDNSYKYLDQDNGIDENYLLDFHSPYGCSKGAADQYFRDYYRIYGIRTVVARQSCIYGYRQFGVEDQGWVAWFIIATLLNKRITIYGDGFQVRDILFIDDLVGFYQKVIQEIDIAKGNIYNVGGGKSNAISIINFIKLLEEKCGCDIPFHKDKMRIGDQLVYISDISKAKRDLSWMPRVKYRDGIEKLFYWIKDNIDMFKEDDSPVEEKILSCSKVG